MKISLHSVDKEMNYIGENERGQAIHLSGSKNGVSPMESVLMAGAACSTIDIEMILSKMKQSYERIDVTVEGDRAKDETPAIFKKIHLHYSISGNVKHDKASKAIAMSIEKYCSVLKMLENSATITFSFEIKEHL